MKTIKDSIISVLLVYNVLTVADTTRTLQLKPQSVFSVLTVSPNITSPANCIVNEQGSTGLTGGLVTRNVTFYVHPYDALEISKLCKERMHFGLQFRTIIRMEFQRLFQAKMTWEAVLAGGITDYRYNSWYIIPSLAFGNSTFDLKVFFI